MQSPTTASAYFLEAVSSRQRRINLGEAQPSLLVQKVELGQAWQGEAYKAPQWDPGQVPKWGGETLATVIQGSAVLPVCGDNFLSLEAIEEAVPQGKA